MATTIKRRKGVTSRPSTRHPNSLRIALVASSVVRMQPRVAHSIQTWPTVARGSLRRAGVFLVGDLLHPLHDLLLPRRELFQRDHCRSSIFSIQKLRVSCNI